MHWIVTVINDLSTDQRMQKTCKSLCKTGDAVTLRGRLLPKSKPIPENWTFNTKRVKHFFQKGKLFYLEFNFRLFVELLFTKYDGLIAVDADTLAACSLASWIKNKPLVYDSHEYFTEVPELQGRKLSQWVWKQIEKFGIKQSVARYTVSQGIAEKLEQQYGKPFFVVRNMPIKQRVEHKTEKIKKKIILYQGALNQGRGLEALIEAASNLPVEIWIAGDGDKTELLRKMSTNLSNIRFLGKIEPADLPALTQQAWLGYNVLENKGLSYYYSLANKFFDYAQAGVPVICSPFPEYKALQKQFKTIIFANPEKEAIIAAIQKCLNDEAYYQVLAQNCLLAARQWTWEEEEKKLLDCYHEIRKHASRGEL